METRLTVAAVMQRRPSSNRWQDERWELYGVVPGGGRVGPRVIFDDGEVQQVLYDGLQLELLLSEREGYYLNVSSPEPRVFVMLREGEGERPSPALATVSYNEAARWMDGGAVVESVPLVPELLRWVGEFVEAHYRPEPKFHRSRK